MTCTRRFLLKGAAAAVITAAPAVAAAAHPGTQADPIFAAVARWCALSDLALTCSDRCDVLDAVVCERLGADPWELERTARQLAAEAKLVEALAKARPRAPGGDVDDRAALRLEAAASAEERAKAAVKAVEMARVERERLRQELGATQAVREWESACGMARGAYDALLQTRATTTEGLKAKLAVIQEVLDGSELDLPELVEMLAADLDTIATSAVRD